MSHSDNCYYIPNMRTTGKMCRSNTVSNTAFRGFGGNNKKKIFLPRLFLYKTFIFCNATRYPPALGPQGMMVTENIVSEVADRIGMSAETIRVCVFNILFTFVKYLSRLRIYHI